MLETLRNLALPTCWSQGVQHYGVVPKSSTQSVEEPEGSALGRVVTDAVRRVSNSMFPGLSDADEKDEQLPKKKIEPDSFLKTITDIAQGEQTAQEKLSEIWDRLTSSDLSEIAPKADQSSDTEKVTYKNYTFDFKYSELCQDSPREGMIRAKIAQYAATDGKEQAMHKAHFSFHLSRAIWAATRHAYDNCRNLDTWMFIVGALLSRRKHLSCILISTSTLAVFAQSKSLQPEPNKKDDKDGEADDKVGEVPDWFKERVQFISKFTKPVAMAAEEARKILHSNDAWLGKLSVLMVADAFFPQISTVLPPASLAALVGTCFTCFAIGGFIGADDPRRAVPLVEAEDQKKQD